MQLNNTIRKYIFLGVTLTSTNVKRAIVTLSMVCSSVLAHTKPKRHSRSSKPSRDRGTFMALLFILSISHNCLSHPTSLRDGVGYGVFFREWSILRYGNRCICSRCSLHQCVDAEGRWTVDAVRVKRIKWSCLAYSSFDWSVLCEAEILHFKPLLDEKPLRSLKCNFRQLKKNVQFSHDWYIYSNGTL